VHRRHLIALPFVALLFSSAPATQPAGTRPNILLITIDTLRADRVGAYGYKGAHTPALDRLAAEGVRFADATAHAVLTFPSHTAILAGRYPAAFGIRLNGMGTLPPEATTLAERLKTAGYRTGAVVASAVLAETYGLDQGFDEYDDRIAIQTADTVALADLNRPADQVTAAARKWIAAQKGSWFLWAHYYDPHLPYEAPAKYAALAPGRPYDGEVAFADAEIAALLGSLDRQRTIVVVTADHGESLGEHGEPDHGFFLYDSTLSVPLIIAGPGITPRIVSEQVRHIDLPATIAELAGLANPRAAGDDGESLAPLVKGGSRKDVPVSVAESWYPRLHFGWSELRSARAGDWKFVAAPKPELYDLRNDRAETKNVATAQAAVGGRLAAELKRVTDQFKQARPTRNEQPDPATIQRLQSLGYLGSFSPSAASDTNEDPKDHIGQYREYRATFSRALALLGRGQHAEAVTALQQIVKMNVRAFEAHLYRQRLRRAGKDQRGAGRVRRGVAAQSRVVHAAYRGGEGPLQRQPARPGNRPLPEGARSVPALRLRALHARRHIPARAAAGGSARRVHARGRTEPVQRARAIGAGIDRDAARARRRRRHAVRAADRARIPGRAIAIQPRHHRRQPRQSRGSCAPLQARAEGGPGVQAGPGRAREDKIALQE
jgi:arylsulfatase A-like enzyme